MADLLVTGVYGQLGRSLKRVAGRRNLVVIGHDLDTLDIRDRARVQEVMLQTRPATVINCAADTDVDGCEHDPKTALEINGDAVGHLAAACNRTAARLVQISTDYVFTGDADRPYTESDVPGPISSYGRSKLRGEELAATAHRNLIVRTAWLYGHGGSNFVEAIRRQIDAGTDPLRVVADQVGSPTLCDDLAEAILDLIGASATGVVHATNSGSTSWHGLATEIVHRLGADIDLVAVTTAEFPRPAPRPAYSVLDTAHLAELLGRPMPGWREALGRYLEGSCVS
jgi:dTDP-4-dehydrorhamnose reductase